MSAFGLQPGRKTGCRFDSIHDVVTLEYAQKFVGGWVEVLHADGLQMIVNDEPGLPLNETASAIMGQPLVGPAILLVGDSLWD